MASMYGIAFATMLIGFTPSYATIGVWSTVIIIASKSIQIFCFGGEYSGAGIYVVEHARAKNEALIGSLLSAATLLGSLFASMIGIIITFPSMPAWSWRIAFFLGGIIGIMGVFYRKNMLESPSFEQADGQRENFLALCKQFPIEIIAGIFIGGFATVPFTTILAFVVPVLMTKGFISSQQFMVIQSILIFVAILALVIAGRFADRSSPLRIMKLGAIALILFSYPALYLLDKGTLAAFFIAAAVIIIINEILLGPSNAFLKNLFPMKYRYRGSSFGFTTGMSLLGGLTPVVENMLYQRTGHFSAISLWLILLGIGTWLSLTLAGRKHVAGSTLEGTEQLTVTGQLQK
jgi:MFS family permease